MKHLDHAAAATLLRDIRKLIKNNSKVDYTCVTKEDGKKPAEVTLSAKTSTVDVERVSTSVRQHLVIGMGRKEAVVPVTKVGFVPHDDYFSARYQLDGKTVRFEGQGTKATISMTFVFS